jgi:hypothetical protein
MAEATALMGVHTLGRCRIENSGYDGWWSNVWTLGPYGPLEDPYGALRAQGGVHIFSWSKVTNCAQDAN